MKKITFLVLLICAMSLGCLFLVNNNLSKTNASLNNQLQQQEQLYSGKIDELTVYQEKLVERISLLEENYQKLQTAYDELKAAYDQYILDSTIERETIQSTVVDLRETIAVLEQNADVDAETITALRTEVTALETSLENQTTTVNELQATVARQESTIASLNISIDRLIKQLNSDLSGGIYKEIFEGTLTEIKASDLEGVTEIRPYAFYSYDYLISIELPDVTVIGREAFFRCTNLTTVIAPKCIMIEVAAFEFCNSLTSFTFDSVEVIKSSAFSQTGFTSITLTKTIEIGATSFYQCFNLIYVAFLVNKPITIYRASFGRCDQLRAIYMNDLNLFDFPDASYLTYSFIIHSNSMPEIATASSAVPSNFPEFWNYLSTACETAKLIFNYSYESFMEVINREFPDLI